LSVALSKPQLKQGHSRKSARKPSRRRAYHIIVPEESNPHFVQTLHCENPYSGVASTYPTMGGSQRTNRLIGNMLTRCRTMLPRNSAAAFQAKLLLATLLLCAPRCAFADDFWKHKPAGQWTSAEALRLVRHSPWAKVEAVVFRYGGDQ